MTSFDVLVVLVAVAAGGVAAMAGFGIGSLLTPFLIPSLGASLAVSLVAVPHAVATAARLWRLRADIDRRVLRTFGFPSAAGGLGGALLGTQVAGRWLTVVLGVLLVAAGLLQLTGRARSLTIARRWAGAAGLASGLFGGLVGNQGGLRSAALLGFQLSAASLVATAAAIALVVDAVRLPVYLATEGAAIWASRRILFASTIGVIAGTFVGTGTLRRLSDAAFSRVIGVALLALGAWLLVRP